MTPLKMLLENSKSIRVYLGYFRKNTQTIIFSFDLISDLDIQNVINTINSSKAYQKGNIPPQIIKINVDICSMTLVYDINKCINN